MGFIKDIRKFEKFGVREGFIIMGVGLMAFTLIIKSVSTFTKSLLLLICICMIMFGALYNTRWFDFMRPDENEEIEIEGFN